MISASLLMSGLLRGGEEGEEGLPLSRLSVRSWGGGAGLPEESIYEVKETPDGYLWLATRDRLVRFDGKNFLLVAPADQAVHRDTGIGALAWDGSRLWLGARDYFGYAGLDRFGSLTNLRLSTQTFPRQEGDRFGVADLEVHGGGRLWILRADGIYRLELAGVGQGRRVEPERVMEPKRGETIFSMALDDAGVKYYGSEAGIWERDGQGWRLIAGSPGMAGALVDSPRSGLWAFSGKGIWRRRTGTVQLSLPAIASIEHHRGLFEDRDGAMWAGVPGALLRIRDGSTETLPLGAHLRKDDYVISFTQTEDGAIWCGTRWGTLLRVEKPRFVVEDERAGLLSAAIAGVHGDSRGRMWAGTRGAGTYLREGGRWRLVPGTSGGVLLHAMAEVGGGRMLLATTDGLFLSDGQRTQLLQGKANRWEPARYQAFSRMRNGMIYYGDSRAVYRLRVSEGGVANEGKVAEIPLTRTLIEDGARLWGLSWETGLVEVDGERQTTFGLGRTKKDRRGMMAFELDERWLLVGTSSGTTLFDRKERRYGEQEEILPEETVFGTCRDDAGNLWFLGRRGLFVTPEASVLRYAYGKGGPPLLKRLTQQQGLASVNYGLGTSSVSHLTGDGELWLASISGAIHFRPKVVLPAQRGVRAAVDGVEADGVEQDLSGELRLPAGTRRVAIHYTALGRQAGMSPTFRYSFLGGEGRPVETQAQEAVFENLGPGQHRFAVSAQVTGDWSREGAAELVFTIEPYWYERRGVLGLLGLLAAVLGMGFARWRHLEFRRQKEELERRVRERTEELRVARDEAEAASKAKSMFLASMSHEVRTPMNGVLGMVQLLDRELQEPRQRELLRVLQASGDTLLHVVNGILDLAKVESGTLRLDVVPFCLRETVSAAGELFRAKAEEKGLALRIGVSAELPEWVNGDPHRIRQVLGNLLSNAVKFTVSGGVDLEANPGDEDGVIRIEVRDTGIGIPAAMQAAMFEPFTQAEATTTRRYDGTGLGLTICKRLVEAMGGRIELHSEVGKGSVFGVVLPLAACDSPAAQAAPEAKSYPPLRVLVVEDNAVNRHVVRAMLKQLGCDVREAANGQLGVLAAGDERYDLILMDLYMPELDGFAATLAIRSGDGVNRETPVWALTASALDEDRARCLAVGMQGHVAKPLRLADLKECLDSVALPS
jgi:signal transduction histidine kinase/CheY-like chemotaxis protein/ligand-binding sensor domain-containing protein